MLKINSPLASAKPYISGTLAIIEAPDFALTQYAGAEKQLKKALGKLPAKIGVAQDGRLRIGPKQIWSIAPAPSKLSNPRLRGSDTNNTGEDDDLKSVFITDLSSSRARIEISGKPSRALFAKCAAIDFSAQNFKENQFVMTGIHHVPVLIHCISEDQFHIFVLRTFALTIWEYLTDAALEFT